MQFLAYLPLLLQLLSQVPVLVNQYEAAFQGRGRGAEKKKAVVDTITLALDTIDSVAKVKELTPEVKAATIQAAGSLVDSVVSIQNAYGAWKDGRDSIDRTASGGQ